jgi:tRNA-2-methylthio-N6-dimethylallyladenosine synthase
MSGRARDGRLVHFNPAGLVIRAGDIVTTTVTEAAPHHLIADGGPHTHRRTRAGDAHAAGEKPRTGVGLGIPGIGVPAQQSASSGCAR